MIYDEAVNKLNVEECLLLIEELKILFSDDARLKYFPKLKDKFYKKFKANVPLRLSIQDKTSRIQEDLGKKEKNKELMLRKYIILALSNQALDSNINSKKIKEINSLIGLVDKYYKLCNLKELPAEPLNFEVLSLLEKYESYQDDFLRQEQSRDEIIEEMAKDNLLSLSFKSDDFIERVKKIKIPDDLLKMHKTKKSAFEDYIKLLSWCFVLQSGGGNGLIVNNKKIIKELISSIDPLFFFYFHSLTFRNFFLENFDAELPANLKDELNEAIYEFTTSALFNNTNHPIYSKLDELNSWDEFQKFIEENKQYSKECFLFFLLTLMESGDKNSNTPLAERELNFLVTLAHNDRGDLLLARHFKVLSNSSSGLLNGLFYVESLFKNLNRNLRKSDLRQFRTISKTIISTSGQYIRETNHQLFILSPGSGDENRNKNFNSALYSSCEKLIKNLLQNKKIYCFKIPEKFISPFTIEIISKGLAIQLSSYSNDHATLVPEWQDICFAFIRSIFASRQITRSTFKNIHPNQHKASQEFNLIVAKEITNFERRLRDETFKITA
jgi:hypothetical protein